MSDAQELTVREKQELANKEEKTAAKKRRMSCKRINVIHARQYGACYLSQG